MAKQKFEVGDVVMAIDKGVNYKGKVLKCQTMGVLHKYFIHFLGWDRKHDIWTDESQLTSLDGDKVSKGKTPKKVESATCASGLKRAIKTENDASSSDEEDSSEKSSKKKRPHSSGTNSSMSCEKERDSKELTASSSSRTAAPAKEESSGASSIKRFKKTLAGMDLVEDDDEESYSLRVAIPTSLKRHLVDEWTLITQDPRKLLVLPRPSQSTVTAIISDFLESKVTAKIDALQVCFHMFFVCLCN